MNLASFVAAALFLPMLACAPTSGDSGSAEQPDESGAEQSQGTATQPGAASTGASPTATGQMPVPVLADGSGSSVDPFAGCTPPEGGTYSGDREFCARARIGCVDGQRFFTDDCGCGCAPI